MDSAFEYLGTISKSEPALTRRREKPNDWFENCTKKLHSIAQLKEGWDTYGASKPRSLSLHYAHAFLHHLHEYVGVGKPAITPAPNGNLCFEWDNHLSVLTTEIDDAGVHHYYFCHKDGTEKEGSTSDSSKILEMLVKL